MSDADNGPQMQPTTGDGRFASLASLRAAHSDLLKRHRQQGAEPSFVAEIEDFIRRGRATGALLDDDEDRWAGQSLLDYWATMLDRADLAAPDATLAEFDPALAPELDDALCPYQGLDAFGEADHQVFFGRQRLGQEMIHKLEKARLLAVVGPSGSGKSSLVLAGLLPALRDGAVPGSDTWRYVPRLVPGSSPLVNLARALRPDGGDGAGWVQRQVEGLVQSADHLLQLAGEPDAGPLLLVIDQFEEVFTLCDDAHARRAFLDNLVALVSTPDVQHRVILTMRIDFEHFVTRLPEFHRLYQAAVVRVTPLSAGELREAIVSPAELVGLKFEDGVVDGLLQDILGEPAALPLLQFTLLKLWDRRERNRVTWDTYQRLGGGRQALAHSADEFYEGLIPEEQVTARRILLRMVRPGEGLEVTSNRIRRAALYEAGEARDRIDRVLERLIEARLVRLSEGDTPEDAQVEVAHEALVRNWPRLVGWLEDERERMRRRLRLTAAAEQWQAMGRDPGGLLRGALLDEALRHEDLNDLEAEFIAASQAAIEQEHQQEITRQRELARAQALAEAERERAEDQSRARKRLLRLVAALVVVTLLALAGGILVGILRRDAIEAQQTAEAAAANLATEAAMRATAQVEAQQNAQLAATRAADAEAAAASLATEAAVRGTAQADAQQNAWLAATRAADAEHARATAQAERDRAEEQLRLSTALQLAATALNQLEIDPQRSILLALEAVRATYAEDKTVTHEADEALHRAVQAMSVELSLVGEGGTSNSVAFGPDGTHLATVIDSWKAKIWDLEASAAGAAGRGPLILEAPGGSIYGIAYSADGTRLVTGHTDDTAIVWDVNSGEILFTLAGHENWVIEVALSPDGKRLATGSWDETARVWDLDPASATAGEALFILEHTDHVGGVAFDPAGDLLVTADEDGWLRIWDLEASEKAGAGVEVLAWQADRYGIKDVAFSPEGQRLATAGREQVARVWDLEASIAAGTGVELLSLAGHTDYIRDLAFSPDGARLATASDDRTAKVWDLASGEELLTLSGHKEEVQSVDFSPDGVRLATASHDGEARVWNLSAIEALNALAGHTGQVQHTTPVPVLAFSSDGTRLATGDAGGSVVLWDTATGAQVLDFDLPDTVSSLAFSPDGRRLAGASLGSVLLWDLASGEELFNFIAHNESVNSVTFSPDGNRLLTSGHDGLAKMWDLVGPESGRPKEILFELEGHTSWLGGAYFTSNGAHIVTLSRDNTAKVWDAATGKELVTLSCGITDENWVSIDRDGTYFVIASPGGKVRVCDPASGQDVTSFQDPSGAVLSVNFSPDGAFVTTASGETLRVWDPALGEELFALPGHEGGVDAVAWSEDRMQVAVSGHSGRVKVWDVEFSEVGRPPEERLALPGRVGLGISAAALGPDGARLATGSWRAAKVWDLQDVVDAPDQELHTLCCHWRWISQVAFSPDGTRLATASDDGAAKVWDLDGGTLLLNLTGHEGAVKGVAFGPDGARLATAGLDGSARVWDLDSGEVLFILSGHDGTVTSVAFSPDGTRLATASEDSVARVWDLDSGELLLTLAGHGKALTTVAFSPDGRLLVTASDDLTAKVWDAGSGELWHTLAGHAAAVRSVAFNPEGTRLATASEDQTVRIWDVASGEEMSTVFGYTAEVEDVVFSPDGTQLTTLSRDGAVRTYSLEIEALMAFACERATRNLSPDEWEAFVGPGADYRETCPGLPVPVR